jgi:AcrR family transcriptional regulator
MLTMRSTETRVSDLTTRARIRDAALARFPEDGFGATTIRAIARDAGVSPGLVVHHFGSKDGLRQACDQYVVLRYREVKEAALQAENLYSRSFAGSAYQMAEPLVRYLGWALARGHDAAGDLFDELVREAVALSRIAIDDGLIHDSSNLEARVAVQMAMQLGAVVMHSHLQRNLGVDLLSARGLASLAPVLFEIFSGLFEPGALERLRDAYEQVTSDEATLTA